MKKLLLDLIPRTAWGKNVRAKISVRNWELIREKAFSRAGNKCEICGDGNKLHLHEIFDYNPEKGLQTLTEFITLCYDCHMVKHWGMSRVLRRENLALKHLMSVNGCTEEEAWKHVDDSFILWHARNLITWKTDLSYYKRFLTVEDTKQRKILDDLTKAEYEEEIYDNYEK